MKKILIFTSVVILALVSCQDKKENKSIDDNQAKIDSLERVISQKDNEVDDILGTFNEIQEGLRQISKAEDRVTLMRSGDAANRNAEIKENIEFISSQMKHNRELVSKLRQKLREGDLQSTKLRETIESLVQQLDEKDKELQQLHDELNAKNTHIAELDQTVSSLNENVNSLTEEGNRKSQTISQQDKQLNTAWYVFGTKSELKAQHIIEGSRVLQGSFNKSYFTRVDIRTDREIRLYSKSAKIVTSHPASSYTLNRDANKQYVLHITNPESFWSTSKYLVVVVK